jgi:hypothetical protein
MNVTLFFPDALVNWKIYCADYIVIIWFLESGWKYEINGVLLNLVDFDHFWPKIGQIHEKQITFVYNIRITIQQFIMADHF